MSIDWSASGIKQTLEHRLVDSRTLEDVGLLEGVTGYTLAESWRGDYRQTGTIEIDGDTIPLWSAVRTYIICEQGGETERHELATLMPEPSDITHTYGRDTANIELHSMLKKLGTNINGADRGIGSDWQVAGHFRWCCTESGAVPYVHPGLTSATVGKPFVWEAGVSYLSEAHAMANRCGGRIQPDAHGRVCLVPYQLPSRVAPSFEIPGGAASIVLPGLTDDGLVIVNKVVADYTYNDQRWFSTATVGVSHPWHFSRIGRWETLHVSAPTIPEGADIQAQLDKLAAQTLAEHTQVLRSYSVELAYMPIEVGQAGTLNYNDSAFGDAVTVSGFVSQRAISANGAKVRMEITLEEV